MFFVFRSSKHEVRAAAGGSQKRTRTDLKMAGRAGRRLPGCPNKAVRKTHGASVNTALVGLSNWHYWYWGSSVIDVRTYFPGDVVPVIDATMCHKNKTRKRGYECELRY